MSVSMSMSESVCMRVCACATQCATQTHLPSSHLDDHGCERECRLYLESSGNTGVGPHSPPWPSSPFWQVVFWRGLQLLSQLGSNADSTLLRDKAQARLLASTNNLLVVWSAAHRLRRVGAGPGRDDGATVVDLGAERPAERRSGRKGM